MSDFLRMFSFIFLRSMTFIRGGNVSAHYIATELWEIAFLCHDKEELGKRPGNDVLVTTTTLVHNVNSWKYDHEIRLYLHMYQIVP